MAAIRMNNGVPILNGTTLAFDDNENCCCSPADTNACTGVTCPPLTGFPNPPNVEITLTSVDANLPITWANITWVKSVGGGGPADPLPANQRRSGEPACVCPGVYTKDITGPRSYKSSFTGFTYADYPYTTPAFSMATPVANPANGRTAGPFIPDKYFLTFTQAGVTYSVKRGDRW
jgi:hypothetical protein